MQINTRFNPTDTVYVYDIDNKRVEQCIVRKVTIRIETAVSIVYVLIKTKGQDKLLVSEGSVYRTPLEVMTRKVAEDIATTTKDNHSVGVETADELPTVDSTLDNLVGVVAQASTSKGLARFKEQVKGIYNSLTKEL